MTHYKLTYFPVRARAEPIRVILSLAEADWEDNRDINDSDLEALNKRRYLSSRKASKFYPTIVYYTNRTTARWSVIECQLWYINAITRSYIQTEVSHACEIFMIMSALGLTLSIACISGEKTL